MEKDNIQEDSEVSGGISVWWLFIAGAVLLSAGWFMKPFPIFMFIGLAPFFAILDHTIESENFWEHSELILVGMVMFFLAVFLFDLSSVVTILLLAIIFTLPFLAYAYVHENLGRRTGKFIVVIFWLGIEFILLKIHWPKPSFFLADAFQFTPTWLRWNNETGYLGATAWIILANWIFYAALLRNGINWFLIFLGLAVVIGPIGYSFALKTTPILKSDLLELYKGSLVSTLQGEVKGELVARTCAWLSILIMVFTVVKSRVTKK